MTLFYYGTFATFAGLGAQLALLGNHTFAGIEGAPSAVALAWLGPVIGALSRVGAGQVSDKIRGGRVTTIMAICNIIGFTCALVVQTDECRRLLDLADHYVLDFLLDRRRQCIYY